MWRHRTLNAEPEPDDGDGAAGNRGPRATISSNCCVHARLAEFSLEAFFFNFIYLNKTQFYNRHSITNARRMITGHMHMHSQNPTEHTYRYLFRVPLPATAGPRFQSIFVCLSVPIVCVYLSLMRGALGKGDGMGPESVRPPLVDAQPPNSTIAHFYTENLVVRIMLRITLTHTQPSTD